MPTRANYRVAICREWATPPYRLPDIHLQFRLSTHSALHRSFSRWTISTVDADDADNNNNNNNNHNNNNKNCNNNSNNDIRNINNSNKTLALTLKKTTTSLPNMDHRCLKCTIALHNPDLCHLTHSITTLPIPSTPYPKPSTPYPKPSPPYP